MYEKFVGDSEKPLISITGRVASKEIMKLNMVIKPTSTASHPNTRILVTSMVNLPMTDIIVTYF